jgi:hypothetical protein
MSCRAIGCDGREWMARKFCDRHWKMLPVDLQIQIRKALEWNRRHSGDDAIGLQEWFDRAQVVISAREEQEGIVREVGLFRTHMATVHGTIAAIRTVPLRDVHAQLAKSRDAHIATDPDGYEAVRTKVERDLEFLELLAEMSDKLGDIIVKFTPPAEDESVEIHTNAPQGVGE